MKIALTGDSVITRRLSESPDPSLSEIAGILNGSDASFTNLEGVCAHEPLVPASKVHGLHVAAGDFVLDELKWIGVNIVNIANNHIGDYGDVGVRETVAAMERRGMTYAGAGATLEAARRPGILTTPKG